MKDLRWKVFENRIRAQHKNFTKIVVNLIDFQSEGSRFTKFSLTIACQNAVNQKSYEISPEIKDYTFIVKNQVFKTCAVLEFKKKIESLLGTGSYTDTLDLTDFKDGERKSTVSFKNGGSYAVQVSIIKNIVSDIQIYQPFVGSPKQEKPFF